MGEKAELRFNRTDFIMGKSKYGFIKNRTKVYSSLCYQKYLLDKHYTFLKTVITTTNLIASGVPNLDDIEETYEFKIEYVIDKAPKITILAPYIEPCEKIHMYKDHSLCLFYQEDLKWSPRTPIFEYIVPWTIEWIYNYELYKINKGKWLSPESPFHIDIDRPS